MRSDFILFEANMIWGGAAFFQKKKTVEVRGH